MQIVLGLLVTCWLGMALTESDELHCPGVTEAQLAQVKSLVVVEDVHDKMAGDYSEIWGPKFLLDADENACVNYTWTKANDTHLSAIMRLKGAWFGGEITRKLTAEKVENGVYVLRRSDGKGVFVEYQLSNKAHVRAHFACLLNVFPPGSKEAAIPYFSSVAVHSHDLGSPMNTDVQAEVDEIVKKVQDHKDLLGEIVQFKHAC